MPTLQASDKLRIPVIVSGKDREILLIVRAKLEAEANRPITITEVFRIAIRELAKSKNI
jgi:hypothetical protein